MFGGISSNNIHCVNVPYTSTMMEKFESICLDIKECKDIYQSFDKLIVEEIIEGMEKITIHIYYKIIWNPFILVLKRGGGSRLIIKKIDYQTSIHGKQLAKKFIQFVTFPPVLHLYLSRAEYDWDNDKMVKMRM